MRIDIIIPAFNAAPFIAEAIRSVLAQTLPTWTLIIVDDGSTDATAAIAAGFSDPRITLLRQPNAGVSVARNAGLAHSDSPAVLFLDADDWLAADALRRLGDVLAARPDAVAAVGPFTRVRPGGRLSRSVPPPSPRDLLARLMVRNQFPNGGSILVRRDAIAAAGPFRPDLRFGEDWEFWARLAAIGPFASANGQHAVCFIREDSGGAYHRMATDSARFLTCLDAVHATAAARARFAPDRLAQHRRKAIAENAWVTGRELIRHGHVGAGFGWLCRSVAGHPTPRRVMLLAAAAGSRFLPTGWRGPLTPYSQISSARTVP